MKSYEDCEIYKRLKENNGSCWCEYYRVTDLMCEKCPYGYEPEYGDIQKTSSVWKTFEI